jgi:hypothetical protein
MYFLTTGSCDGLTLNPPYPAAASCHGQHFIAISLSAKARTHPKSDEKHSQTGDKSMTTATRGAAYHQAR